MEKHTPHCRLSVVRRLVEADRVRLTASAARHGRLLGFDRNGIVAVVASLTEADFYKSMTTYANHAVWQDVYRPVTAAGAIYLKLTVADAVLVVSFKELES
ncbi:type II toxin-antitoxin system MqsR family toxin [Cupriavidus sp. 30B13]|uniref:type II toxin-antitoxin system MqsR family toxin n=1 Tax=Cupriavidus sp. 30B13 TaxID=3384241 RepID=UPI003B8FCB28